MAAIHTPMTDEEMESDQSSVRRCNARPWRSYVEGRDHSSGSDFIMTGEGDSRGRTLN